MTMMRIVSDIRVPDMDGLTLMGRIHEGRSDIPIILMTAQRDHEVGLRALKEGAYAFLPKPIDTQIFLAWLSRAIHVRQLSREVQEKTDRLQRQTQALEQAVQERTAHLEAAVAALKHAEHANRHLAALVESSEDAIISNSPAGIVQTWNQGAAQLYGYTGEEVIGRHIALLIPAERQAEEEVIRKRIMRGERLPPFETVRVRKDGSPVQVSLTISPILDEHEQVIGASKIARDITERKRAQHHIQFLLQEAKARERELVEKQAQLVHAAKLASIGELTTGIAHELNNPLNNISLLAGNVMEELHPSAPHETVVTNLNMIKAQVDRAATIINHLRTFGRASSESMEPISLNDVIRSPVSFVSDAMRLANITVKLDLSPHEPSILGNRIRLEQVFVNLLTNARDALKHADTKEIWINSRVRHGAIEVVFRDTGPGIPPDVLPRIFDPFFTTKPSGEGTGLGLSISYGIVKEHHGDIEVESSPEKGTRFVIQLPILQPGEAIPTNITGAERSPS
jgi:PAS domain S-box-containing protein